MLNLTPHAININGTVYEPSGTIARAVKEDVSILTATLTSKVRIKVCTLPIKGGTIIRYGVSKDGIIEQGRSIRVAKMKLKKQLKYTDIGYYYL